MYADFNKTAKININESVRFSQSTNIGSHEDKKSTEWHLGFNHFLLILVIYQIYKYNININQEAHVKTKINYNHNVGSIYLDSISSSYLHWCRLKITDDRNPFNAYATHRFSTRFEFQLYYSCISCTLKILYQSCICFFFMFCFWFIFWKSYVARDTFMLKNHGSFRLEFLRFAQVSYGILICLFLIYLLDVYIHLVNTYRLNRRLIENQCFGHSFRNLVSFRYV